MIVNLLDRPRTVQSPDPSWYPTPGEAPTLLARGSGAAPVGAHPVSVGRYRIEGLLGAGAMGAVYAAYDPDLDRRVALKLLRPGASADRLRREAQALARLSHPNVVAVYDVGPYQRGTFVAMALVDGNNVRAWLAAAPTTTQILEVMVKAARGVAAAHAAGIVHRDLKPDNIFVGRRGEVLVGDFGLARAAGDAVEGPSAGPVDPAELTRTGVVLGTPAYMAPEQARGDAVPASDQFSLCVTAWEAFYGERPFSGKTIDEIVARIHASRPTPVKGARRVPVHVERALRRGLAPRPALRHPSVDALVAALTGGRPKWPWIAGAGASVLAAAATAVALAPGADRLTKRCDPGSLAAAWTSQRGAIDQALARVAGGGPAFAAKASRRLQSYVADWSRFRLESCRAENAGTLSRQAGAAIERCLARRATTFIAVVPTIAQGDPTTIARRVEGFEPVERCRDIEPSSAEKSNDGRERLYAEVDLLDFRQRTEESALVKLDLADLVRRAEAVADSTALAEALHIVGVAALARGRTAEAERRLRHGVRLADSARNDRVRARAAAALVEVLARSGRVGEAALQYEAGTAALARRGADPLGAIAVEHARAMLERARGDRPAEQRSLRVIVELQRARFGAASISVADALFELAGALQHANVPAAARQTFDDAVREHATVAPAVEAGNPDREANAALVVGDFATAIDRAELAASWARRGNAADLTRLVRGLAFTYEIAGDFGQAGRAYLEAIALVDAMPEKRRDLGFLVEALESAGRVALEVAESSDDGKVRHQRLGEALAVTDRALALAAAPGTVDHEILDALGMQRARVLGALGRWAEALPLLRAALADAENARTRRSNAVAVRSFVLAEALWEVGGTRERARAKALADQAAREFAIARPQLASNPALATAVELLDRRSARLAAWRLAHR